MKILVVGSGAREHALVWKLAGEPGVSEVLCAPGNGGIAALARCCPVDAADPSALLALADREDVDLTVVGPEQPLAAGAGDLFHGRGRLLFGPTRRAAALEASKVFAKQFMARHAIQTARFRVCDTAETARAVVASGEFDFPVVLKADGLAAGKGVVIATSREEAERAVASAMVERCFGAAGARLVIEEFLDGREASAFAVCDGTRAWSLPSAQDHKRAFDGDRGPNTGGMGAIAPSPLMTPEMEQRVTADIVEPALDGLREEGRSFTGVLYAGLILTPDGPRVVEFNVRLGDPEAQVILPMLEGELLPLLVGAAAGRLERPRLTMTTDRHVGVVLASRGYPGAVETGKVIEGLADAEREPGVLIFHAGTRREQDRIVTSGGRVLTVVGRGRTYRDAAGCAYRAAAAIRYDGKQLRTDIGATAAEPLASR